jgi:outer membrane protein OmpA-like peptidoglycan-associated protein
MHRNRKVFLAVACAICSVPAARPGATEVPALPALIELLRPPGDRGNGGFSTTALSTSRARPAVDEAASRTTAPEGTAAAALALPFQSGSATLTPDAEKILEALGRALNSSELSRYRFRIEGHTDTAGEAPVNLALSERRTATVREHLVSRHGVAASRLDALGLGETQLLVQTPDATSEPRNRRVQIVNIGG